LFKPNKTSLPKVWRNVKVKRKKKRYDAIDCNSFDDSKNEHICLEFGSALDPELITCDDEVILYFIFKYYGHF